MKTKIKRTMNMAVSLFVVMSMLMTSLVMVYADDTAPTVTATDVVIDGLKYDLYDDNTATVKGFDGDIQDTLTIPATVQSGEATYDVTAIGDVAFGRESGSDKTLTKVIFPNTIKKIGKSAFRRNYGLTEFGTMIEGVYTKGSLPKVLEEMGAKTFENCELLEVDLVIPGSLKIIPDTAFWNCKKLTSITIEEGVERIDTLAFHSNEGINGVTTITVPASVKQVNISAFARMKGLTEIIFKGENTAFILEGVVDGGHVVGKWDPAKNDSAGIGGLNKGNAKFKFDYADSMINCAKVLCNSTITGAFTTEDNKKYYVSNNFVLNVSAFNDDDGKFACSGVSAAYKGVDDNDEAIISLGTSVTGFADSATAEQKATVDLSKPIKHSGVEYEIVGIATKAFNAQNDIMSVYIPNTISLAAEGKYFESCKKLTEIVFEEGITSIPNMIWGCEALNNLVIPASCTSVAADNFAQKRLDTIIFAGSSVTPTITDIGWHIKSTVNGDKKIRVYSPGNIMNGKVTPEGNDVKVEYIDLDTVDVITSYAQSSYGDVYMDTGFVYVNEAINDSNLYVATFQTKDGNRELLHEITKVGSTGALSAGGYKSFNFNDGHNWGSSDNSVKAEIFLFENGTLKPLCEKRVLGLLF